MTRDARKSLGHLSPDLGPSLIKDLTRFFSSRLDVASMYQAQHMLAKYAEPTKASAQSRRSAAIKKWQRQEDRNFRTNMRLLHHEPDDFTIFGTDIGDYLEIARREIKRIIGSHPPRFLSEPGRCEPTELPLPGFSGGASTSTRRDIGMVERKFSGVLDVTKMAWRYMYGHIINSTWHHFNEDCLHPRFVDHSIMFTVPKSDVIDRVACKEPDANMYLQKACGDFIRMRLRKRASIDLNNQSINRNLARVGVAENLATIDLSSASDSVCTMLVRNLLPLDWYYHLDDIRVSTVLSERDGQRYMHDMEMFSTMGNGFTFELESLIFYALCYAVRHIHNGGKYRETVLSVYGDDIIISSGLYAPLRTLFSFCGFTINDKKSFRKGLFRESCGGHYHAQRDITPFFVRGPVKTLHDLIRILNRLRYWASGNGASSWACSDAWPLWRKYARHVPPRFHGGWDCSSVSTLVSAQGRADRLLIKKKDASRRFQLGGYLSTLYVLARRGRGRAVYSFYNGKLYETWHESNAWSVQRELAEFAVKRRIHDVVARERILFDQEIGQQSC